MTDMLNDLMTGRDEVDAFLSGKRVGYKVTLPDEVDVRTAADPPPARRAGRTLYC